MSATLVRLFPSGAALGRWAATQRIPASPDDLGYAAHAASRAVFGTLAPKPFALRMKAGRLEMIGYTTASVGELSRVGTLQTHDEAAALALGVADMTAKAMPDDWKTGERFSFECRVVPTRRSRMVAEGRYLEVDVAIPTNAAAPMDRHAAYARWLEAELMRFGAAQLHGFDPFSFALTPVGRRNRSSSPGDRAVTRGLVPNLLARGELEVRSATDFNRLLARGLGRHRTFGFGCLLLAPRGVLHAASAQSLAWT